MKRSELKEILKPVIKECVREVILDEGILSGLISEVARGMGGVQVAEARPSEIRETQDPTLERLKRNAFTEEQSNKMKTHKTKLMKAIGSTAYNGVNLFEGTTPAPPQRSEDSAPSPLASQAAADAGVDISGLFGAVGNHWDAHLNEMKERK